MNIVNSIEKIGKPGLWFVRSSQPTIELCHFICRGIESGRSICVYSNTSKKEMQDLVFNLMETKHIDSSSDESERFFLEEEMAEYKSHGILWHPNEFEDNVSNDYFLSGDVYFYNECILEIEGTHENLFLIDNFWDLWYNGDVELSRIVPLLDKDVRKLKKTVIAFISSYDSHANDDCIKNYLLS